MGMWAPTSTFSGEGASSVEVQMILFESTMRRRQFREILQKAPARKKPKDHEGADHRIWHSHGHARGPTEVLFPAKFMCILQLSCVKERDFPLVGVSFAKPVDKPATGTNIEVVLMSRDALTIVGIVDFVQAFFTSGEFLEMMPGEKGADDKDPGLYCVADSDSDDDGVPAVVEYPVFDGLKKMTMLRSQGNYQPLPLSSLKGVWFLADAEPRVRLQFTQPEDILFFSETDRQRWRQQLNAVLEHADATSGLDEGGPQGRGKGWYVAPTEAKDHQQVNKELKSGATRAQMNPASQKK